MANYYDNQLNELLAESRFFYNETTQTMPALIVQYIGSEASGTVTVAAGGDMTFKHGALSSEAVDGGIGASGVLDLSTPAAGLDTMGELVDTINASANWRAILVGARRADSTDNTLAALSEAQAKVSTLSGRYRSAGLYVYMDEQVAFKCGFSITNKRYTGVYTASAQKALGDVKDAGYQNELAALSLKSTYGSGTSAYTVYLINDETNEEITLFSAAGGATTVAGSLNLVSTYGSAYKAPIGYRIFVQLVNSAAMTATLISGQGRTVKRSAA